MNMTNPSVGKRGRKAVLFAVQWLLLLALASSVLVHLEYSWNFASARRDWLGHSFVRTLVMFEGHLLLLFGPSIVLLWLWRQERSNILLPVAALLLAAQAYAFWQPPLLAAMSALDLYPTHLEAFQNDHLRGDWLAYSVAN